MILRSSVTYTLHEAPPSINRSNTIREGQIRKTHAHTKWKKPAQEEIGYQRAMAGEGEIFYWSVVHYLPRDQAPYDVGNATKALTDLLVSQKKVPDDRYLVDERCRFVETGPVRSVVTKEELSKWQKIMKPSKSLLKRLEKSYQSKRLL